MSHSATLPEDACLAAWCAGDEWCAITCTMDVIENKWHPVIVDRLLAQGPLHFNQLADEIGPITNKVLSNSLQNLEESGLVDRTIVNDQPVEVEYALTDRGRSLEPVIDALAAWGREHLGTADDGTAVRY